MLLIKSAKNSTQEKEIEVELTSKTKKIVKQFVDWENSRNTNKEAEFHYAIEVLLKSGKSNEGIGNLLAQRK